MAMTREEHLAWAKQRALEYLERGEPNNAIASMLSDLGKHPEMERSVPMGTLLVSTIDVRSAAAVRHWIEGFN
jgi:hypothetical protein